MSAQLNSHEEEALIAAASKGDKEAFGEIIKLYEKLIYNLVRLKVGDDNALDVSQEVFIKIWRYIGKYRGECKFSTWVYKICTNACLDKHRQEKNTKTEQMPTMIDKDGDEVLVEFADESADASPEASLDKKETVKAVREAINKLPPDQREVILLRDIEGYSYERISEMLSIEIGTLKSRLNRARIRLRELLSYMISY